MGRLIGVSTSPLVGSIHNMGVWDKVAAAWVNVVTRRTLDREEAARRRYKETGRSLENAGCIGDPHIVGDRCVVFLCILYCCMAIGGLQVAFIKTGLVDLQEQAAPRGPTCGRGATSLHSTLLQEGVSIKLPPLFGGGCHRGRGQCTPLGGWVGCHVRGCR